MKKLLCVLLVLMLSLGLASAAFAEKIVVIGQQLGNVVFLPAEEGMKAAGKDLGIEVEWQSPCALRRNCKTRSCSASLTAAT